MGMGGRRRREDGGQPRRRQELVAGAARAAPAKVVAALFLRLAADGSWEFHARRPRHRHARRGAASREGSKRRSHRGGDGHLKAVPPTGSRLAALRLLIEHRSYLRRERGKGEGLGDQIDPRIEPAVVDDGIPGVSGREEYLQFRAALARLIGEITTVKRAGQTDIGEEQLDLGMADDQAQRGITLGGLQYVIAEFT